MVRWEPDSRGRLAEAAMVLYAEQGFDQTTVAEIAERAGLTERTFFRHFADKREVLFSGAQALQELLVTTVVNAPAASSPLEAVTLALEAGESSLPIAPGLLAAAPTHHRFQRGTTGARTHQAGLARRGAGGCVAPTRRQRSDGGAHRRDRHRPVQGLLRPLGLLLRIGRHGADGARLTRSTPRGHRDAVGTLRRRVT